MRCLPNSNRHEVRRLPRYNDLRGCAPAADLRGAWAHGWIRLYAVTTVDGRQAAPATIRNQPSNWETPLVTPLVWSKCFVLRHHGVDGDRSGTSGHQQKDHNSLPL